MSRTLVECLRDGPLWDDPTRTGETLDFWQVNADHAADVIEGLRADRDNWKDQAFAITENITEKAKAFGHDGFYGDCPSDLLTDVVNQFEDETAQLRAALTKAWGIIGLNMETTSLLPDDDEVMHGTKQTTMGVIREIHWAMSKTSNFENDD